MSENVQANIGVDEIRQLINRIQQKPTLGSKVMALIPNIERLSEPAMNSLLKTLEEPPGRAVIVMTTSRIQNILPTLRSRCHLLRCSLVSETVLSNELQKRGADRALAKRIAAISNGAPGTALHWIADQAEYMKTEKDLSGIADLRKSSRMEKIRFIKDNCSGNEVAQQREIVKTFSDHWLQIEREQLSGSNR
jgi:DNA polymerase III gamma/tau subunit